MKRSFSILLNLLVFFFILGIFGSAFSITGGDTVVNRLMLGIVFAVLMSLAPNVLKFFKIDVNGWSLLIISILLAFIFFFISLYVLGLISVQASTINIGLTFMQPIHLQDRTIAMVFLSVSSSIISVVMDTLSKSR
jgi:hypothetical protein